MDSRVAVQEYATGEFGAVAIDTGITKLHTGISQFGESADKDFNANGQAFGDEWHPVEHLHQQHRFQEFYADC
jgi:hypothetical protein